MELPTIIDLGFCHFYDLEIKKYALIVCGHFDVVFGLL
jgi:hypothetical protein